ncbi:MAG: nuclear transport factor 2 family protein [Novosphingobium sp.]|nr:nuclear transport factor 2 family protein [Novosphingobium sp.]
MVGITNEEIAARLDRVESRAAIQDLAVRYAIAVDSRDIQGWTDLFVPDVNCGRFGVGREALRQSIEPALCNFYRSIHMISGHAVDFDGPDRATGMVYCRAEHEVGERWIVMAIIYSDEYARSDGRWFFVRRKERHWYATDMLDRPIGENSDQWELHLKPAALPSVFSSWKDFWELAGNEAVAKVTSHPID